MFVATGLLFILLSFYVLRAYSTIYEVRFDKKVSVYFGEDNLILGKFIL